MTPKADYICVDCGHTAELSIECPTVPGYQNAGKGWSCKDCGSMMLRVWTPVGIGKGTSGRTPPR